MTTTGAPSPRDPAYPRPQLRRDDWWCLDGPWDFALDPDAAWDRPAAVTFDRTITVPFAPETPASGIGHTGFLRRCWYRRTVDVPAHDAAGGDRLVLHVGAVDRHATVWADGHRVADHVGGFTPVRADVTPAAGAEQLEIVIRADDEPRSADIPRGKQDWLEEPHLIWYPRTTGVWQTVWIEVVPAAHVAALRWRGDPDAMTVHGALDLVGVAAGDRVAVTLSARGRVLAEDEIRLTDVVDGRTTVERSFGVGAGVDDRFDLVWRPGHPALVDATVELHHGAAVDVVRSYTALRTVGVSDGRFVLNGRPRRLRLALDQGYWPESGMTAPSVDALAADVDLVGRLGLNGVRKHQKVEDPRWLALCDEAGLLVWEELPSAFAFTPDLAATLAREWAEVIERDRNHPCIVAWVPLNESWGVPEVARDARQQALVEAMVGITAALDPTRPVNGNDGWETLGGDVVGIHDYDQDAGRLAARYRDAASVDALFVGVGPSRRPLALDGRGRGDRAVVLSEFGGATLESDPTDVFSYGNLTEPADFLERVRSLCRAALDSGVLSGFCWTQLTDTYQEKNGLVRADRSPKVDLDALRRALAGDPPDGDAAEVSS